MPAYTLRQLTYFLAIAETGSISDAAATLHVSQSAVASALTELERVLRSQLCIRRKSHGVTLTPSGHFLVLRARALLKDADELEETTAGRGEKLAGRLALGCYVSLAPTVLPPLLEGFSLQHPDVSLDFREGSQDELQEQLLAGTLDLAVLYGMDLGPELDSVDLYSARAYVLLPDNHPLREREHVSLAELSDEPMILLDVPPSSHHTMSLFERQMLQPRIQYRTSDFELTRSLVGRGLGYTILVQRPRTDLTYEGQQVIARPIHPPVKEVSVKLAWPHAIRLNNRTSAFVDYALANVSRSQLLPKQ
ncbi:LysR family transcriptional regulator [Arthrobacter pigmenti]